LLFTNTDSLVYHITTNDIFDDMIEHKKMFDLSNFPTEQNAMMIQIKEFCLK
jgi:hypothetical protein